MVSNEDVAAFKEEMDVAQADYEVVVHPGAQHGFTSKEADSNGKKYGIPVGYNASADQASWAAMMSLYTRKFQSRQFWNISRDQAWNQGVGTPERSPSLFHPGDQYCLEIGGCVSTGAMLLSPFNSTGCLVG